MRTADYMTTQLLANYRIGGEWMDSATRLESTSPATGEVIGTYADGSAR
jgi:betaine-aldehyde dehydrogenase